MDSAVAPEHDDREKDCAGVSPRTRNVADPHSGLSAGEEVPESSNEDMLTNSKEKTSVPHQQESQSSNDDEVDEFWLFQTFAK